MKITPDKCAKHQFYLDVGYCMHCGLTQQEFEQNPDPSKCHHLFPMDMPGCMFCGTPYSWGADPQVSAQTAGYFRARGWNG